MRDGGWRMEDAGSRVTARVTRTFCEPYIFVCALRLWHDIVAFGLTFMSG